MTNIVSSTIGVTVSELDQPETSARQPNRRVRVHAHLDAARLTDEAEAAHRTSTPGRMLLGSRSASARLQQ